MEKKEINSFVFLIFFKGERKIGPEFFLFSRKNSNGSEIRD
jgi:hypothetical protein